MGNILKDRGKYSVGQGKISRRSIGKYSVGQGKISRRSIGKYSIGQRYIAETHIEQRENKDGEL